MRRPATTAAINAALAYARQDLGYERPRLVSSVTLGANRVRVVIENRAAPKNRVSLLVSTTWSRAEVIGEEV